MKNLTQDRWLQINTLFQQVLDQPVQMRHAFLQVKCRADAELMQQVEELLQIHEEAENILGDTADAFISPLVPGLLKMTGEKVSEIDEKESRVGSYEILKKIGEGGMGTVYMAKKTDAPYDKKVALKLIRRGIDTQDIHRRFQNEGQILASLEHPNIARLYDGGIHDDGRPFFVMEYIEGEPIDSYCDKHKLSVRDRLKLFRTVCEAVHFAHQNLIVHRDIKPANVLVTQHGSVKLVDFGIAKLLEPGQFGFNSSHTQTGIKVMTPEFASPEQIQGKPVTTASDVYGLGILLYLILTGRKPYVLGTASMLDIERMVCKIDPVKPSDAVTGKALPSSSVKSNNPFDPESSAKLRTKDSQHLKKELAGDLDRITLMALRKEPEQRYRSALGLAEDLDNYLKAKPVLAHTPTFRYRTRKFIQRNKLSVLAAAIAIISVFTGLGIALWQADVARTERNIAQSEAAKSLAVQDYLVDLFEAADPSENRGEEITVREIVERGIAGLEEDFGGQPEVHIEMMKVLGRVQQALGDFNLSVELLEEALEKTRELYGDEHLNVASAAAMLGEVERWNGSFDRAENLLREALAIRRVFISGDDADIASDMDRLARTLEMKGDFDEAELLYNKALGIRERLFGENSDAVSANLSNLGWLLYEMGKRDEAEHTLRKALEVKKQIMEPPHPAISSNMGNLAVVLRSKGNYREAEEFAEQALQMEVQLYGEDHPRVTTALNNRSLILLDLARYKDAAELYKKIIDNNRRQLGSDHFYIGFSLSGLAIALIEDGRNEEALPFLEEAIEVTQNALGEEHRYYAMSLGLKGEALYYQNPNHAIPILERAKNIFILTAGPDHPVHARILTSLGRAQFAIGEIESAEIAYRSALNIQREALHPHHPNIIWTLTNLGRLLTNQGYVEEAEQLLREATVSAEALPEDHWRRIAAQLELSACLLAQERDVDFRVEIEEVLIALQDREDYHATRLLARARKLQNPIKK